MDKVELLTRVLQAEGRGLTMIFARTKRTVQRVADDLADRGFAAAAVHGDLGQGAREQALRAFRSGKVDVLVATDVAARGIDVTDVTHVINYQCPEDSKTYVHRIGRTGRAGKEGVAVTLVDWDELHKWKTISDDLGLNMPEAPETYSTSDHLFTDLSIPTNAKGRLPHSQRTRAGLDAEYVDTEGDHGGRKRSGDRDRGDRRGGRPAEDEVVAPRRPRRERTRTRSRAGVTADGAPESNGTAKNGPGQNGTVSAVADAPAADQGSGPAVEGGPDGASDGVKPRRRRRRGGARRRGEAGSEAQDSSADDNAAAS
jgi:superfamily II DNA/RNA helicase